MAKKKIKMNLFSQSSLQDTINYLQNYKNELQAKCDSFVARCASIGEEVALQAINESPIGNSITFRANTTSEDMGCKAVLFATGEVKEVEGREPFQIRKPMILVLVLEHIPDKYTHLKMAGIILEKIINGIIHMVSRQRCQCIKQVWRS